MSLQKQFTPHLDSRPELTIYFQVWKHPNPMWTI
jgi:hypothetical protein